MDIKRITEVGVAVHDLDAATKIFVDLFGATKGPAHLVSRYQMRYRMCRLGNVDFELMEPTSESGVIADFLKRRGQGLHHIAFAVDDIETGFSNFKEKGVSFVDELPIILDLEGEDFAGRKFAGDVKIAFSNPSSILGILFEFIEYPKGYETN